MAKQNRTLYQMSSKLGLNEEEKVLCKAEEFQRLLQMKSTVSNLTDTAKAVICLDLAANYFRVEFDQKAAVRHSGLKGPTYFNSKKIVENVLELNNEKLTISSLCLTLQCSVQDLAENILTSYRKNAKIDIDMNLPQYVCMAVYQACRVSKIKVSKSKLVEKSQLKPGQWSKLDAEWTKFTDEKFAVVAKKTKGKSDKKAVIETPEEIESDSETFEKKEENMEPQIEPYQDWKRRILEEAYAAIARGEDVLDEDDEDEDDEFESPIKPKAKKEPKVKDENDRLEKSKQISVFSPRRSPRKTPQKFQPYASPIKGKCVRLLFPL